MESLVLSCHVSGVVFLLSISSSAINNILTCNAQKVRDINLANSYFSVSSGA